MLVRIPSDYLRQKILEKRVWYVGDSMFQAVQWTSSASPSSPPLDSIQIWAHLTGIPLDLRHQQGLSLVAGLVGEPKETDDFTLNLVSLTLSHVKVEVDLTIPLPSVVEFTRESGEVVEVSVAYPWVPPTCTHCKELGHIMKNCLQVPLPAKPAASTSKPKGKKSSNVNKDSAKSPGPSTSHEVPVSLAPPAASLSPQGSSAPSPLSQPPPVPIPVTQTTLPTLNLKTSNQLVPYNHSPPLI
ncbi:BnaA04g27670D [Brassica napus]|uniref:BnaA04g27670D protein n=1 Tax=Brassica napus TaxID=3708 RepID=A0A078JL28_BRANA|nr:BnaA04g27670D [Brassica napus]